MTHGWGVRQTRRPIQQSHRRQTENKTAIATASVGTGSRGGKWVRFVAVTRSHVGIHETQILAAREIEAVAIKWMRGSECRRDARTTVEIDHVVAPFVDRGATWRQLAELCDQKWSTLFMHRGAVHLIGTTAKVGHKIVRRSTDAGQTWTEPTDAGNGLLAEGKFHCAPTAVIVHAGRIWRSFEEFAPTPPLRRFMVVLSTKRARFSCIVAVQPWSRCCRAVRRSSLFQ